MSELSKEVRLPQGTIRYRDDGDGEPLVFLHGLLVNGRLWEGVAERLAPDFRCIVPDLPLGSHSVPMNPDADLSPPGVARLVIDFLDALALDRVTLVGNDSGGAISQLVATAAPERVGRLILTNCDAYDNFPPKLFAYFKPMAKIPGGLTMMTQTMRVKPLRRSPIAFGVLTKSRLPDELLDSWLDPGINDPRIREDTRKFILGIDPAQTERAARDLEGFRSPTLFAWAPEDRWFKIAHAESLAASMPDARVVRIPDAKTFVSLDQPEKLADAIASFVRETKPLAAAA
jgi:pimeloyl-ACP methyl ester carboxylesterase